MIDWWMVTAVANSILVVSYGAISFVMIRGLGRGAAWGANPLAMATVAIFVTCTVGHGIHLTHVLLPASIEGEIVAATRASFGDPLMWTWDGATAVVAIVYWRLRGRFALMTSGPAFFEDMRAREEEAIALNDGVVQGLQRAKAALEAGERDAALAALEETLGSSRRAVTQLLGPLGSELSLRRGDLRRKAAAQGGR